jgi:hypothetical protein
MARRPRRRGLREARPIAREPKLIVEIPSGGALERQLEGLSGPGLPGEEVAVDVGATDPEGNLEAPAAGEVVLSVPSPEALRDGDQVHQVIAHAGTGVEPLVVVVEAAEELREDELTSLREAAARSHRPVILRVMRQV